MSTSINKVISRKIAVLAVEEVESVAEHFPCSLCW